MVGISSPRRFGLGREDDPLPRLEPERPRQVADPNPRSLQIEQDGRRIPPRGEHLAQAGDPAGADFRSAVRRVDADDVDPRVQQRGHLRGLVPRWAQGGDDLGAADRRVRHLGSLMRPRHRRITISPPTTVSSARPARKAAPFPRSTAGSTAQATKSASMPAASVPRRRCAPAAIAAAAV